MAKDYISIYKGNEIDAAISAVAANQQALATLRNDVTAGTSVIRDVKHVANAAALRAGAGTYDGQVVVMGGNPVEWVASSTATDDNIITFAVTGVATGRWIKKLEGVVTPEMADLSYSGDEQVKIQNMLNAGAGRVIVIPAGKNLSYNGQLEIKAGTTLITNGSIFTRLTPSTTHGIVIRENVSIDRLIHFSAGGSGGDKAVLLTGSNFNCDRMSLRATSEGSFTSTNWALEIDAGGATYVGNIEIKSFRSVNYRAGIFGKRIEGLKLGRGLIEVYQIGVYLIDCSDVEAGPYRIRTMSTTLTGNPGENGLLIESTSNGASNNLTFNGWAVSDSGEHGYRLGGQYTVSDVFFNGCQSTRPGRAGYVAWPEATEWHGGSGFKVLGGTIAAGRRHRNIHLNDCTVTDCSLGEAPYTHGVNNFTAFQIAAATDVFLNNCKVRKAGQDYSALQALIIGAVTNIHITNFDAEATKRTCFRPHDSIPGNAGLEFGIDGLFVNGMQLRSGTDNIPLYMDQTYYNHNNWKIKNLHGYGGSYFVRIETPISGGFGTDMMLSGTYQNSSADDATYTSPIIQGNAVFMFDITGPWRTAAFNPASRNGSKFTDSITGNFRIKRATSVWGVL